MSPFQVAPGFTLPSAAGGEVALRDLRGRYAVLYFYPRAGTPGCTQEAGEFHRRGPQFAELEARVVGISPDPLSALRRFAGQHGLSQTLLSDSDRTVARAYGAITPQGRIQRSTFLIDRAGVVRWQWPRVKVAGHADDVLATLRALHAADNGLNPLILARRAYRALSEQPVSKPALERLVEAAHLAPSCFNNQPWRFVVAQGEVLERVKAALPGGNYWAKRAPAILALCSHRDLDCKLSDGRDYFLFGCGMATGMLMIQATQMGLVAHPIAGYDPLAVKVALGIPADYTLITLIVVGKPGDVGTLSDKHREIELGPRDRKPLPTVLGWDRFGDSEHTEGT
ncbi:MAG: Thiol peroxidase, Bcp-type [Candidatus Bipolaricaulis sibiricus]|uniref:thioredoxin-dependent peroxiredoxin n=1 Tax=Bipolaricaulis sibiricus TaxID=2501609 RepID=A0A410FTF3_BIPS1|nr:MAG: Thiol peroxidase, Bcp-type [Candidatus Bipolaricaulis sibiricus]